MPAEKNLDNLAAGLHPVLNEVSLGYRAQSLIYGEILPELIVPVETVQIESFGHDAFVVVNDERSPRNDPKRIVTSDSSFGDVTLREHSLEELIDVREIRAAKTRPGGEVDIESRKTKVLQHRIELRKEVLCAGMVTNAGIYPADNKDTLTSTAKWSHDSSDPQVAILAAAEAIRRGTGGQQPNRLMLPVPVFNRLRTHPKVRAAFAYQKGSLPTADDLVTYFGIPGLQIVLGSAATMTRDGGTITDVWSDFVLLYYRNPVNEKEAPTFGWTLRLNDPQFQRVRTYDTANGKGRVVQVNDFYAHYVALAKAGFLWTDAL
ncbi:MAG: major capsid protein [Deltaproteobacteria bacterium]|nr:major capsid protein [Deltaproteobacteria bacterium]